MTYPLHLSLDQNHLVSCLFPCLLCFLLPSLYLALEISYPYFYDNFSLDIRICFLSWSFSLLLYNNLPKALLFIISFSSATQKCNQQGLTVNLNFSVWLPTFSIMLSRYHLSLTSYSHTLPPFWPFSLLSVSFALFVYVFITTWVPKLEWFSVHLSKFYKDQTKPSLYGFLNYMNPHLKLFCKEC